MDSGKDQGIPSLDRSVVQVRSASGEVVATGTLLDSVNELRTRAAAHFCILPGMVLLLHEGKELQDAQSLEDVAGGAATLQIMLVRLPCQARAEEYGSFILRCDPHACASDDSEQANEDLIRYCMANRRRNSEHAMVRLGAVQFPDPQDVNINMMPFIIGSMETIPEEYQQYWPMIQKCKCLQLQHGRVGYLTIHESPVQKGEAQRRPGLHVETHCVMRHGGSTRVCHHWGLGQSADGINLGDGIYMASTVAHSTRMWDVKLESPAKIVGHLGDVEHLRPLLGEGTPIDAGQLIWFTDTTPHESMPLPEGGYRQYFRLVSSSVSVWYEQHSTKNRLGIEPDPKQTQILTGDKFDDAVLKELAGRTPQRPPMIVHP